MPMMIRHDDCDLHRLPASSDKVAAGEPLDPDRRGCAGAGSSRSARCTPVGATYLQRAVRAEERVALLEDQAALASPTVVVH